MALKLGEGTFSDSTMATIAFRLKLNALVKKIKAEKILGSVLTFVWRIEYQIMGLLHAHCLFWTDCNTTDVAVIDKVVNVRFPRTSPFCHEQNLVADFRTLVKTYQIHNHSQRCARGKGRCKFGYPQPISSGTVLRGHQYVFERNAEEVNVVPHNPRILALFRCHHCLEVIHSDQCIGYVLKYCSKNSDEGQVCLEKVIYEGREINRSQRLEYFAATRVCSARECFAGISGYWRHHLKPAVVLLNSHLPGKKVVLTFDKREGETKVDLPSRVERYFGRPLGDDFERLTYPEYFGSYVLSPQGDAGSGYRDLCHPSYSVNRRKKSVLAGLNSVSIRCLELLLFGCFWCVIRPDLGRVYGLVRASFWMILRLWLRRLD
jgi:hypothetical protein